MKFESLLTFWKMSEIIIHKSCLTRDRIYDDKGYHITYTMTISNGSLHANILYRYTERKGVKSGFALIYADILFSGFPDRDNGSSLFKRNVKIADLENEFVKEGMYQ